MCLLVFWALGKQLRTYTPVKKEVIINMSISKKRNK